MKSALILFNPRAGSGRGHRGRLQRFGRALADRRIRCRIQALEGDPGRFEYSGENFILVAGGDGTLHHLLPRLLNLRMPVGVFPMGTANVLARELHLPFSPEETAELVSRERKLPVVVGCANDKPFLLMAGCGPDAWLIRHVAASAKRRFGVLAFWWKGMTGIPRIPLRPFSVEVRNRIYPATFAVISNVRRYGGKFLMAPHADLQEPLFDVAIFQSDRHLRYLRYLPAVRAGKHLRLPDVIYVKSDEVRLSGAGGVHYQLDGEFSGNLPLHVRLDERRLNLLVPNLPPGL
ncbi:MAG TPA: diacylglycerol kinase family protein [Acidobacteriota bacterium]|nr:diacylglycerol kinase family protein [Acidobacteriota bacterium]